MLNDMKTGNAPGPVDVSLELIADSREIGIQLMAELYCEVLERLGMPSECALSIIVPTFKGYR